MENHVMGLRMFGTADGESSETNGNGLTGDFEADFNKYFGGGTTPVPKKQAEEQTEQPNDEPEGKAGEESEDSSGQRENADAQEKTAAGEDDPDAEFEKLTGKGGKYNAQMTAKTQKIINERFKQSKLTEKELNDLYEAISPIMDKYGYARGGNIDELAKAILTDKSNLIQKAIRDGIELDEASDYYLGQREKAQKEAEEKRQQEAQALQAAKEKDDAERAEKKAIYDRWQQEAKELQKTFPQFELAEEIKSSDVFVQAIEAGMSVKNAYYAAHHEDIMANVAGAVAQTTAAKAAEHYAAVSRRPREGAAGAAPGAISKKNVNDLTEKDIMSILKRVEKGEKITF